MFTSTSSSLVMTQAISTSTFPNPSNGSKKVNHNNFLFNGKRIFELKIVFCQIY